MPEVKTKKVKETDGTGKKARKRKEKSADAPPEINGAGPVPERNGGEDEGKESPVASQPKKVDKRDKEGRKVVHPHVYTDESTTLTVEKMKDLLGWEEEGEGEDFGADYLLKDRFGRKVRCTKNVRNRPFYPSHCRDLVFKHLKKRWKLNGEPIIVGKTDILLDGQHSLISGVLAEQERVGGFSGAQSQHWTVNWPVPVTMEKIVVYGIDEDDETVNTINTGRSRTLSDVIFRSDYFRKFAPKDRRAVSRMLDYAIRILWQRTGANDDPFTPRRTSDESTEFLERHRRLLRAVKHIFEENKPVKLGDGKDAKMMRPIGQYVNSGAAAALLYLMGCSSDAEEDYWSADHVGGETKLKFGNWEKACDFWVLLAAGGAEFKEVRFALGSLVDADSGSGGRITEKVAVLCKAWNQYLKGDKITKQDLKLRTKPDDFGVFHLVEEDDCLLGGIDQGMTGKREDKGKPSKANKLKEPSGSMADDEKGK